MFITLSRQYAAGGSEIARMVAEELGWTVVDNAFVDQVSQRSGFDAGDVAELEERVPGFLERLARSSALSLPEQLLSAPELIEDPAELKLARITQELVSELGRRDRIVMVGRAAAAVLAREEHALHVRLVAPEATRLRSAIERLRVPAEEAPNRLAETDRNRERYHREYYGRDWNDPANYHMVLNTDLLGYRGSADLILARARALGWQ
ncbi:MAG: cytidylate kinase-like family protein [Myxococcales bacterium]|nr:cytidylate kinase-like family protein [Myxococcales bacterium]